jgi:hypothetical protein
MRKAFDWKRSRISMLEVELEDLKYIFVGCYLLQPVPLSSIYFEIRHVGCMKKKTVVETQYKIEITFHFSSCVVIFLGDKVG